MLIVPVILLLAFWFLKGLAQEVSYKGLKDALYATPSSNVIRAIVLCAINYMILTLYDMLAFRYIRHPLSYAKIGFTAFISFAFSQTVGFALLSGGAIRYRLYSAWGCSAQEIAKVIAFSGLHFWMGLFLLSGIACLLDPADVINMVGIASSGSRLIGIAFLAPIAVYLFLTTRRRESLWIRNWEIPMPSLKLASLSLAVACLDWIVVAAILHSLLPVAAGVSFYRLLLAFFVSQAAGVMSHVPGGLGVFETVMVVSMSHISRPELLASLLLFRGIYYLLPFAIAVCLLVAWEMRAPLAAMLLERAVQPVGTVLSGIVPPLLALNTFIAGAVLLFSGVMPIAPNRMWIVSDLLPIPVVEVSHFINSIVASLLMILAWGIWKRVDAAYVTTLLLLFAGIAVSLLKGLDYEEAGLLFLVAFILYRCTGHFYRKAALFSAFRGQTVVAFLVVLVCSIWLGFFIYHYVDYSNQLWWQFTFEGHAARFLRATVGASIVLVVVCLRQLLSPAPPPTTLPSHGDFPRMREILARYPSPVGNLAFLLDKYIIFSERGDGFLMYRNSGRTWVALGDPVGDEDSREELIWRFRDLADHHDGLCAFYQIPTESLYHYVDIGLRFIKLGEEAIVDLPAFTLEGGRMKSMRHTRKKLESEGISFVLREAAEVETLLPQLRQISEDWLRSKNTAEKGFSLGFFSEDYLRQFPLSLVLKDEKPVAFANILAAPGKKQLSVDLMRHSADAPAGVMDYLFTSLMLWGKEQGYREFNLGMAPLGGLEARRLAPIWAHVSAIIREYGEEFYNFEGLRDYKDKFGPRWEPRYLAYQGKLSLPRIILDIATLISGGMSGILRK